MAFLPSSLTSGNGARFSMESDEQITLDPVVVRAVAGYDESEVAWILDHPDFMGGDPYAAVTAELGGGTNGFLALFNAPAYVGSQLDVLGWQEGHQRIFTLDHPAPNGLGYVVASVNRFSSPAAASSALDVIYADLTATGAMVPVEVDSIGDRSAAVAGGAVNGVQMTALVADGSYLFVVTGVAPNGDPTTDVEGVLDLMLGA